MNMNRTLLLVINLILIALYNFILFTLAEAGSAIFWSGYIFTMIAFVAQYGMFIVAFKKDDSSEYLFFGIPLAVVSMVYLAVQIIAGIFVTAIPGFGFKTAIIMQALILVTYAIIFILAVLARNTVGVSEGKTKEKVFYIKSLESDIGLLESITTDMKLKKELNQLRNIIKYSDPISHDLLAPLEQQIFEKATVLVDQMKSGDYQDASGQIIEISGLFELRNSKCKLLK